MNIRYLWFLLAVLSCNTEKSVDSEITVGRVQSFEVHQVSLGEGPFKHAVELNRQMLLTYEPDRLLAKFRSEAGLEPRAEHYYGWEDESLAGHSLGHYLSAMALMFETTGEQEFYDRAVYIVDQLAEIQQANGGGYLGAFPNGKKVFEKEVAKGNIRSQGFDLNGIWAPFYTHHKVMAGLRDSYRMLGIEKALEVERNFADWIGTIVLPLNDQEVQKMLHCEHGGMNEVLVELYNDTGDEKYLDMANVFYHKEILDPLAAGEDILPGKHGNTQIPKLIGLVERYKVTGNEKDSAAASFFWDRVVNHHSYVTGGHGNHEYFGQPDQLNFRLSDGTTETCNVYNMLKLSAELFELKPSAEVADFYERALFNHILASQNPTDGRVIYNLSLEMGGRKFYQDPEWFTCCVGSGMETHAKFGSHIFFHTENALYINQFIDSELDWQEMETTVKIETSYPEQQGYAVLFENNQPHEFTVYLRFPYWAEKGMTVLVNGDPLEITGEPGSFVPVTHEWSAGDRIDVEIPFSLRIETMPDNENRIAVMHGPLVLAARLGPAFDPDSLARDYVPILLTEERDPNKWLKPAGEPSTFMMQAVGHPRNVLLKPFYKTHEERYTVYLDIYNEAEWEAHEQAYMAELERKKLIERQTYDFFQPGEMQSERDHDFMGDSIQVLEFKDRKARYANRGGWFSFRMKVQKGRPMKLNVEYWGGFTGSRTFDILVNNQKIATENISGMKDGFFVDAQYDIPAEIIENESVIDIKFMPHTGNRAGPIFSVRTLSVE